MAGARSLRVSDAEAQDAVGVWYATIAAGVALLGLALVLRIAVGDRSVVAYAAVRVATFAAAAIAFGLLMRLVRYDVPLDFGTAVSRRLPDFRRLPALLEAGVLVPEGDTDRVEGRFDGLPVRIRLWTSHHGRRPEADVLTYQVAFPHPWRAAVRRSRRQRTPRWSGVQLPPDEPALRAAVDALFDELHARELRLLTGGVQVKLPANVEALTPDHQRLVLSRLRDLARLLAGPTEVAVVELSAAPRASADASCPYCRERVDDPAREACPACRTPQHAECMDEHGGCTILGCQGGPTRRVRVR